MFGMIPMRCQFFYVAEDQQIGILACPEVSAFRRTGVRFWDGGG